MSVDDEGFELRETQDGETTVLALWGDLDLAAAETLDARLSELQASGSAVFLDLSPTAFIDSSGLASITRAVRDARDSDWSVTVGHEVQAQVQRLLELVDGNALFWPNGR